VRCHESASATARVCVIAAFADFNSEVAQHPNRCLASQGQTRDKPRQTMIRESLAKEARQHRLSAARNDIGQNVERKIARLKVSQNALQGLLVASEFHYRAPFLRLHLLHAGCISWTFVCLHFTHATT
jgi:hypothetical protein